MHSSRDGYPPSNWKVPAARGSTRYWQRSQLPNTEIFLGSSAALCASGRPPLPLGLSIEMTVMVHLYTISSRLGPRIDRTTGD